MVPTAGARTTSVRKLRENVRSPLGSTGLPVRTTRAPCDGEPVMSVALTNVYPMASGAPLTKLVIPESCHPLSAQRTGRMDQDFPGTAHT